MLDEEALGRCLMELRSGLVTGHLSSLTPSLANNAFINLALQKTKEYFKTTGSPFLETPVLSSLVSIFGSVNNRQFCWSADLLIKEP